MQSAEKLFSVIAKKARNNPKFRFRRLYRNLFQPSYYYEWITADHLDHSYINEMCKLLKAERYQPGQMMKSVNGKKFQLLLEQFIKQLLHAIYPARHLVEKIDHLSDLSAKFRKELAKGDAICRLMSPRFSFAPFFTEKIEDGRWWHLLKQSYQVGRMTNILHQTYQIELEKIAYRVSKEFALSSVVCYENEMFFFGKKSIFTSKEWRDAWGSAFDGRPDWMVEDIKKGKGSFFQYAWVWDQRNSKIKLLVPPDLLANSIRPFHRNGKATEVPNRLHLSVEKLCSLYKRENREITRQFQYANNRKSAMEKFRYYHFQSLLLTLAKKEKVSVKVIRKKYRERLRDYWV